jgi:hypothetical protein
VSRARNIQAAQKKTVARGAQNNALSERHCTGKRPRGDLSAQQHRVKKAAKIERRCERTAGDKREIRAADNSIEINLNGPPISSNNHSASSHRPRKDATPYIRNKLSKLKFTKNAHLTCTRIGLINADGIAGKEQEIKDLLKQQNNLKRGPKLGILIITESKLGPSEEAPTFDGWEKPFSVRDTTVPGHGGVTIYVRSNLREQVLKVETLPERCNVIWLQFITTKGVFLLAGVYSRPNHPAAHVKLTEALAEDAETLRQQMDVAGIIVAGDLNSRFGDITGDTEINAYAKPALAMMRAAGLAIATENKLNAFTCIRPNGNSINDVFLRSTGDTADADAKKMSKIRRDPRLGPKEYAAIRILPGIARVHRAITFGRDHRLVTFDWSLEMPNTIPNTWGVEQNVTYEFTTDNITKYQKNLANHEALASSIKTCNSTQADITRTQKETMAIATKCTDEISKAFSECAKFANKTRKEQSSNTNQQKDRVEKTTANVSHMRAQRDELMKGANQDTKREQVSTLSQKIANEVHAQQMRADEIYWRKIDECIEEEDDIRWWKATKSYRKDGQETFPPAMVTPAGQNVRGTTEVLNHVKSTLLSFSINRDEPAVTFEKVLPKEHRRAKKENAIQVRTEMNDILREDNKDNHDINRPFEDTEIERAIESQKLNKASDAYGMRNELLRHGGDHVQKALAALYAMFWRLNVVAKNIQHALIKMLHKKGAKNEVKNHRPITLAAILLKTYEKLLQQRIMECMWPDKDPEEREELINIAEMRLSKLQGMCKPSQGSLDTVAQLLDVAEAADKWAICSYDLSRAFDRVNREMLFVKLRRKGIQGRLLKAIMATYSDCSAQVQIGKHKSEKIVFKFGIKQGSVLSPILFVIFVEDLLEEIEALKLPDSATGRMFMDDLATINTTLANMQRTHDIIMLWCAKWGAVINSKKLQIIHSGLSKEVRTFLQQNGIKASYIDEEGEHQVVVKHTKYLGVVITPGQRGRTMDWSQHTTKRTDLMTKAFNLQGRRGLQWSPENILTNMKFMSNILLKIGLFGAELWNYTEKQAHTIDKAQVGILKKMLQYHPGTPTMWVLWETEFLPADLHMDTQVILAWRSWKKKEHQGAPIPKIVIRTTHIALNKWSANGGIAGWTKVTFDEFPGKEAWSEMVHRWAAFQFSRRFHEWCEEDTVTKEQANHRTFYEELKPNLHNARDFITQARGELGGRFKFLLKARAQALLGVPGEACWHEQQDMDKRTVRPGCPCGHPEDTVEHMVLECPTHSKIRKEMKLLDQCEQRKEDVPVMIWLWSNVCPEATEDALTIVEAGMKAREQTH